MTTNTLCSSNWGNSKVRVPLRSPLLGLPMQSLSPSSATKVLLAALRPRQIALLVRSIKIERTKSQELRR
jgi:hypothetical protein